jgi:curved DNA-binding protein CbpA
MNSDYYAILGLQKTATDSEIRTAYRELARLLHPDKTPRGEALMQAVNEAHEVLIDPQKRREYDRFPFPRPKKVSPMPTPTVTGTVDLTKLAQAFIPQHVYHAAGPSMEHALKDRGIDPKAASVENILTAFGLLKKRKGARKSA